VKQKIQEALQKDGTKYMMRLYNSEVVEGFAAVNFGKHVLCPKDYYYNFHLFISITNTFSFGGNATLPQLKVLHPYP